MSASSSSDTKTEPGESGSGRPPTAPSSIGEEGGSGPSAPQTEVASLSELWSIGTVMRNWMKTGVDVKVQNFC